MITRKKTDQVMAVHSLALRLWKESTMLDLVLHWYAYVEVYAVLLVWIVVPLTYVGLLLLLKRRLGVGSENHGAD
jgi:hypothetical protein